MAADDRDPQKERRQFQIGTALGRAFLGTVLRAVLWVGGCCAECYLYRFTYCLPGFEEIFKISWPLDLFRFAFFELGCALVAVLVGDRFLDRLTGNK